MKKTNILFILLILLVISINLMITNFEKKETYQVEAKNYQEKEIQKIIHRYPDADYFIKKKESLIYSAENKENTFLYRGNIETIKDRAKPALIIEEREFDYSSSIVMTATAYDLSYESTGKRPGDKGYGITYSGTQAGPGTVAVDPDVIPLGTRLYIESIDESEDYGFAVAEDIGSAIQGNRIDLFINDHDEAVSFGKREVKVYILDNQ